MNDDPQNDGKTPPESPIARALRMKKAAQAARASPRGDKVPRPQRPMAAGASRPAMKK